MASRTDAGKKRLDLGNMPTTFDNSLNKLMICGPRVRLLSIEMPVYLTVVQINRVSTLIFIFGENANLFLVEKITVIDLRG